MKRLSTLAFKYMIKNKQRTITTVVGVMITAMLVYAIFSVGMSLFEGSVKSEYSSSMAWDAVYVCDYDTAKEIAYTADYYGDEKLENKSGVRLDTAFYACDNGYATAINDFNALPMKYQLKKGVYPNSENGIIISDEISKFEKITIGDDYTLENYNQYDSRDKREEKTYKVCGIYKSIFFIDTYSNDYPDEIPDVGYGNITLLSEEDCEQRPVCCFVSYADKHDIKEKTIKIAESYGIESGKYAVNNEALQCFYKENDEETTDYVFFKAEMLAITALISFVVIFIVRNAFNISVHERSNDYGILRCIGLSRRQIIKIICQEGIVIGIIGTSLGLVLGNAVCKVAFYIINLKLGGYTSVIYRFSLTPILWTFVCMLIVTLYSMISPIQKLYKLNPIEALRNIDEIEDTENQNRQKKKKSERKRTKEKKKFEKKQIKYAKNADRLGQRFGVEIGYAYKNLMRKKGKFILGVVTLSFGVFIFIASSCGFKNISGWMFDVAGLSWSGVFQCSDLSEQKTISKDLAKLDCVKETDTVSTLIAVWNKKDDEEGGYKNRAFFIGLPTTLYEQVLNKSVKGKESDDENTFNLIGIGYTAKEEHQDEIFGYSPEKPVLHVKATIDEEEYFSIMAGYSEAYMAFDSMPVYIYEMGTGIEDVYHSTAVTENNMGMISYTYYVKLDQNSSDLYMFDNYVENTMHYYMDYTEETMIVEGVISITKLVIEFVIGIIMVLFFVNTVNTQRSQMLIRKNELRTLRTIGMSKKQKNRMLMAESMAEVVISVVIGTVAGTVVAFLSNRAMYRLNYILEEKVEYPDFLFDWPAFLIVIIVLPLLGLITAKLGVGDEFESE